MNAMVESIVHTLFERLNDVPKDTIIAERYADKIADAEKST